MTKGFLLGTSILAAASFGSAALAQDDEIIVTATKREQTLQEVPIAVSVVDGDVIQKAEIVDLLDLQTIVPSLRVSQLERAGNSTFIVRGFGNGGNNIGIEPSVAVYVDGVFRSRATSSLGDLPALERVEVLRGPQNTLFGKGASAGVVSIVTQAPQFERQGSIEASVGNYNLRKIKGYVTGPLGDDTAFSLAANVNKRDGYVDEVVSGEQIGERDRWGVRAQLLHEASDNVSIKFIGDYEKAEEICCYAPYFAVGATGPAIAALGGNITVDPYGYEASLNRLPENEFENWGLSGELNIALDWADFTAITAYRENFNESNGDVDFSSADLVGGNLNSVGIDTFTTEMRLAGQSFDGKLDWLVGGFYLKEGIGSDSNLTFGPLFSTYANLLSGGLTAPLEGALGQGAFFEVGTGTFESFVQSNENYSIFAQADLALTDRLTATVGIGYVDDHKEVTASAINNDLFSSLDLATALNDPAVLRALPLDTVDSIGASFDNAVLATTYGLVTGMAFDVADYTNLLIAAGGGDPTAAATVAAINATIPAVEPGTAAAISAGLASALGAFQFLPGFIPLDENNPVENQDSDDTQTTYTLRLAYDLTDRINVYGSYATGFKPTSWNLTRDSSPNATDFAILQQAAADNPTEYGIYAPQNRGSGTRFAGPEDVTVWELGLKANYGRGAVNVAVFDQTIEGFQSTIFSGTGFVLANAGEQTARGLEIDGTFDVTDNFTIGASGLFLDPEYADYVNAPVLSGSAADAIEVPGSNSTTDPTGYTTDGLGDLTGAQPAGIHTVSLSFNATYEVELSDGKSAYIRGDYQYEDEVAVVDNLPESIFTREVNLFNASAGISWENGVEASVWGRNIFGDEYTQSGFPTTTQSGSFSGYPNLPPMYGVTVRKNF